MGLEHLNRHFFIEEDPDDELIRVIYVGVDSGTRNAITGVRVENKRDSVDFFHEASYFQLYAGKCQGSDFGGYLLNQSDDSCDSSDVRDYARKPGSYPLSAALDSSETPFTFTADNQQDYVKP